MNTKSSFGDKAIPSFDSPWPPIDDFKAFELPPFPVEALPKVLRDWVAEESVATQTPADLAGLLALAVCAACIARRVTISPRDGYCEPTNLFVAVLLEPGNRKSAVFSDATAPLREIESALIDEARTVVASAASTRRQDEARLKKLEKKAGEGGNAGAREEAGALAARLAEEPLPVLPRLLVDDATTEKLGMMLESQGGRIASMSAEGGVFDLMGGLYSKSGAPQFDIYLKGHSGDDLVTDRVGREGVRVRRPALTCAYAIQPQVVRDVAKNPAFRGRGLLARFLFAIPRSRIGCREVAPPPVSNAVRLAYEALVQDLHRDDAERTLHLSPEATRLFLEWEEEAERLLGDGGELECLRDWGGKLVGATLRLAAILHVAERSGTPMIEPTTIRSAIEIARYLIPHAEAVLNQMAYSESQLIDDARYILRWIERHSLSRFSKTEAHHHGKRRFRSVQDIEAPLGELERRGFIRRKEPEQRTIGRPRSTAYEVNPTWLDSIDSGKRSHNSRNSIQSADQSGFGSIGNMSAPSESTDSVPMVP